MKVYNFQDQLPAFKNAVLTIGTFDGVHVGHQTIISRINALAEEIGGESVVLTFHPHPRLVLQPDDDTLKLINTQKEKTELLEKYGVDHLIVATFTEEFAQTDPTAYVEAFLVKKIHPKKIVIGYDHHFGKDRKGNMDLLRKLGITYGYEVEEIPKQLVEDIGVSSTKIRKALLNGNISMANELLGHPFMLTGKVVKGHSIGTRIGYPTANISVENKNKLIPAEGVYAALVNINGERHKGMMYIGNRPTYSGKDKSIEINIFDLDADLYDLELKIEMVAEIRSDIKFDSEAALKDQLAKDKITAQSILDQG